VLEFQNIYFASRRERRYE